MDVVELRENLHMLRFPIGQAYLLAQPDSLLLIDTGLRGSGTAIADTIRSLGRSERELATIVLTHYHDDHAGSAAEIRAWGGIRVLAHELDAPVIRGDVAQPPPVLTELDRGLYEAITPNVVPAAPCEVDEELTGGARFADGAVAVWNPGHTEGSIAVHLPEQRVLFTGDTAARIPGPDPTVGVFNIDHVRVAESFRLLAGLDAETVCFGHGEPLLTGGQAAMQRAAATLARA